MLDKRGPREYIWMDFHKTPIQTIHKENEEGSMNVKPLADRVLVRTEEVEEKTAGGIYIPQTAQEKTQTGVVVAIGEDEEIKVKAGDRVMYDKYAGTTVAIDGTDHLILRASDLLAVIQ
jgi:chaperonin GroES